MTPLGKLLALSVLAVVVGAAALVGRMVAPPEDRADRGGPDRGPVSLKAEARAGGRDARSAERRAAKSRLAADEPDPEYGLEAAPDLAGSGGSAQPAAGGAGAGAAVVELASADPAARKLLADCDALAADPEANAQRAWVGYNTLLGMKLSDADARVVKGRINRISDTLLFGRPTAPAEAPFAVHTVRSGERLTQIAARYKMSWELLCRMNGNLDPKRLRAGQALRVWNAPVTVVVYKSQYELDVLLDGKVIRAYAVGHGQDNSTPVGRWMVKNKMRNPAYTHPRTGERFAPGDPKNPVGTRFMGLEGQDDRTRGLSGYAIHGTIDPASIGKQMSLGCVRLVGPDIEELYDLLTVGVEVEIRE
jgi:LysM repeat protein